MECSSEISWTQNDVPKAAHDVPHHHEQYMVLAEQLMNLRIGPICEKGGMMREMKEYCSGTAVQLSLDRTAAQVLAVQNVMKDYSVS